MTKYFFTKLYNIYLITKLLSPTMYNNATPKQQVTTKTTNLKLITSDTVPVSSKLNKGEMAFGTVGDSINLYVNTGTSITKLPLGGGTGVTIVQATGTSTTSVMSQNAVSSLMLPLSGGTLSGDLSFNKTGGAVISSTSNLYLNAGSGTNKVFVYTNGSSGTSGQLLASTGTGAEWKTVSIPAAPGYLTTSTSQELSPQALESLTGSVSLHKVSKTGSYSDLLSKPTIPSAPGTLSTTSTGALTAQTSESLSTGISLHKISKTGTYSDLLSKPTIPSAPGYLTTTSSSGLSTQSSESLTGSVSLHKVSKTGSYNDLLNLPSIPSAVTVSNASGSSTTIASSQAFASAAFNKANAAAVTVNNSFGGSTTQAASQSLANQAIKGGKSNFDQLTWGLDQSYSIDVGYLANGNISWTCICMGANSRMAYGGNFQAVCIGTNAVGISQACCVGHDAINYGECGTAVGSFAKCNGKHSVALGSYANTTSAATNAVAIGMEANASNANCIAIGRYTKAASSGVIAIGMNAESNALFSVAIGYNTTLNNSPYSVAIGYNCVGTNSETIVIGTGCKSSSESSITIGDYSQTVSSWGSIAIGSSAYSSANRSTAIGYYATIGSVGYCVIGSSGNISVIGGYAGWTNLSDERDKTDITPVSKCLDFINALNPVQYVNNARGRYDNEECRKKNIEESTRYEATGFSEYDRESHRKGTKKGTRKRVGLIAQQVQNTLMEIYGTDNYADIVHDTLYDTHKKNIKVSEKFESQKFITYQNFIPFLIGAVQELTKENKAIREDLGELNETVEKLKTQTKLLENKIFNIKYSPKKA
jgi:hypothetical protein